MEDSKPHSDSKYTGEPVKVWSADNQPEAEFLQSLLEAEGIPSMLQRSGGADVPGYVAGGRRDILVPSSAAERSKEILTPIADAPVDEDVEEDKG